jgi:hypothetical protein
MKDNKNKIVFIMVGLLLALGLLIYLAELVLPKALIMMTRATSVQKVSVGNSFLLGEKVMAMADGKDKCVVDVFVLGSDGKGIYGKQVSLMGLGSLNGITDSLGKATFELTSSEAKQYELTASVNGIPLIKTVKVTFR